jgi:DnaJ-class molecular chaperone
MEDQPMALCPDCWGTGKKDDRTPCPGCEGTGWRPAHPAPEEQAAGQQ